MWCSYTTEMLDFLEEVGLDPLRKAIYGPQEGKFRPADTPRTKTLVFTLLSNFFTRDEGNTPTRELAQETIAVINWCNARGMILPQSFEEIWAVKNERLGLIYAPTFEWWLRHHKFIR